jgi:EAL domain-containing protein (putative c-di-GMP-specific phosphodiesterase class I)
MPWEPHPVDQMLEVIRRHLGMDVAFVSSIDEQRRVFRHVASGAPQTAVVVGAGHDLEATYCTRIVSGALGALTPDAQADPVVSDLPITGELGIRGYAGVPITVASGRVYGTLCAFSHDVHDFGEDDVHALELAAALIAHRLDEAGWVEDGRSAAAADRALVAAALEHADVHMVFQPVVALRTRHVLGYEALARFAGEEVRGPEDWFAMARRLGLDVQLQRDTVAAGLRHLPDIDPGRFLAVNLSDAALLDDGVRALLRRAPADQLVVELTEQEPADAGPDLLAAVAELRDDGVRIALDDLGAGYASLERILSLTPELIKLDRALVVGIWDDPSRQAMVQSLATFARAVDAEVVAEGIEAQADADALRILGVSMGQGFLLGAPADRPWADEVAQGAR